MWNNRQVWPAMMLRTVVKLLTLLVMVIGMTGHSMAQGVGAKERLISGVIAATSAAVEISYVQPDGEVVGRIAGVGDPVYLDDEITTGPGNRLQILLADQTVFSIGPDSALVIDSFVFDPTAGSSDLVASVKRGSFKFISGKIAKQGPDKMKLRLPNSTASIRGTSVAGTVGSNGDSSIVLLSGAISVASVATNNIADLVQPGWGVAVDAQGSVGAPEQFSPEDIDSLLSVVEFAPLEEEDGDTQEASAAGAAGTDEESGDEKPGQDETETASNEGGDAGEPIPADAAEVREILAENGVELDEADVAALIEGEALIAESEFEELFGDEELSPDDLEKELTARLEARLEARLGGGDGSDEKASSLASLFVQGFAGEGKEGDLGDGLFAPEGLEFGDAELDAPRVSFDTLFSGNAGVDGADGLEKTDIFAGGNFDSLFATPSLKSTEPSFEPSFDNAPDVPEVKLTVARYAVTFDDLKVEDVQFLAAVEQQPIFDIPAAPEPVEKSETLDRFDAYIKAQTLSREALLIDREAALTRSQIGALMVKYLQDGGVPQWATATNDGGYVIGNPVGAVAGTAYAGVVSEAYSGSATFSKSGIALGRGSITLNTVDGAQTWKSTGSGSGTASYKIVMNYDTGTIDGKMGYSNLVMNGTSFADATGNLSSGGAVPVGRVENIDLGQVQSQDATSTYTADVYTFASIGSATDGTNVVDGLIGRFDMNFYVEGSSQYVTNEDGDYLDSNGNVTGSQAQAAVVPVLSATDFSSAE